MEQDEVKALSDYAYRVARGVLRNEIGARDVAQTAMEICYRRKLRTGATAKAFVRKVTRGVCADYCRQQGVRETLTGASRSNALDAAGYAESMEQILYRHDLAQAIRRGMSMLPPMQRKVFEMRRVGYRHQDIADQLGIERETAKTHLQRAYGAMRDYLVAWGFAPSVKLPGKNLCPPIAPP